MNGKEPFAESQDVDDLLGTDTSSNTVDGRYDAE